MTSPKNKRAKKNAPTNRSSLCDVLETFAHSLEALYETFHLSVLIACGSGVRAHSRLERFIKHCAPEGSDGSVDFNREQVYTAQQLVRQDKRANRALTLIPRTFVVALVCQFDAFTSQLIRALYLAKPELLADSERTITFSELSTLGSVPKARDTILEKEIETFLRNGHVDQFTSLENRFKIPLRKDLAIWPCFVEVTQRRNLYVHNDGRVSQQYLDMCAKEGVRTPKKTRVGDELTVSPKYFSESYECVFEMGVKLGQVLWRKLLPEEVENADENLIEIGFNLLLEERHGLAARLHEFATKTLRKHSSDLNRRILVINHAQAEKWRGDGRSCEAILKKQDWSACEEKFKLCVHVLRDEYEEAAELMRGLGENGPMRREDYEEWPVFREFRDTQEFKDAYSNLFPGPYTGFLKELDQAEKAKGERILRAMREAWSEERKSTRVAASEAVPES